MSQATASEYHRIQSLSGIRMHELISNSWNPRFLMECLSLTCTQILPQLTSSQNPEQRDFLRIFLLHEQGIQRHVTSLVPNMEDAQKILQQTAALLCEDSEQYDRTQPFPQWASRYAILATRKRLTGRIGWQTLLNDDLLKDLTTRRQELLATFNDRLRQLPRCLDQLPTPDRLLLDGYYSEQLDAGTLASLAECTTAEIYRTLQRIRQQLRESLENSLQQQPECRSSADEFDDAVAELCHGVICDQRLNALHELLVADPQAMDKYLWQAELHAALSARDFGTDHSADPDVTENGWRSLPPLKTPTDAEHRGTLFAVLATALVMALLLSGGLRLTSALHKAFRSSMADYAPWQQAQ